MKTPMMEVMAQATNCCANCGGELAEIMAFPCNQSICISCHNIVPNPIRSVSAESVMLLHE